MKVSLSWLKEYVRVDMDVHDLADALTMAGLEVEAVSDRFDYLKRVVVGRIVEIGPHPDEEKLKLCIVDIGGETIPVVCGAPNAAKGVLAPCAMPGTCLPDGTVLEKRAVQGQVSAGMLCSEAELGLGIERDRIMELDRDTPVGALLNQAVGLSDTVFEIDLTPNRPDCLSIMGVAREVAAIEKKQITYPDIRLPDSVDDISDYTSVTINDPELCPRYAASLIFDITVQPSPYWLQDRLISVGLKPINNIVDITNFVMMETGQPLHAFDFDNLAENRIVVRTARSEESFVTLDGKERRLDPEMLMICDGVKPVAIGGVMGGLNSEVENSTTRILLESAYFNPVSIRKTSKKLGLNTDASHRFERGVDPGGTIRALHRATQLMVEIGGGRQIKGTIDAHPRPVPRKTIILSTDALNRRLGIRLGTGEIKEYLKSIEFEVEEINEDRLKVFPPSCRVDISRFEDLTEELARLYGYNNIETTFPIIPAEVRSPLKKIDSRDQVKRLMIGLGFNEIITYSFISNLSGDRLELDSNDNRRQIVDILNPLSEDQTVLRTSMVPGLLETMRYNISLQNRNLKLFEIGNVYFHSGEDDSQPEEVEMLAALWTGTRVDSGWYSKEINSDFYDLKGVIEELLGNLGILDVQFTRMAPALCFYTRHGHTAQILVEGKPVGLLGELHPKVLTNYDLKQTAFIFEINFDQIFSLVPDTKSARAISRYPATSRDITLIVSKDVEAFDLLKRVEALEEALIETIQLFDVFEGDPIPEGEKSVSFRITYRSFSETLEDDRINKIHRNIADKLLKAFDAALPA
ncbi:phenylalanine--tRNA ligase subunit beta [Thermodesulfobacteriota bacterium]